MKDGTMKQRAAYQAIEALQVLEDLRTYTPVLCGTIPIGIDVDDSDLDIVMEVNDLSTFKEKVTNLYGGLPDFTIKHKVIDEHDVVKANFMFKGFEFELFGQDQPVQCQRAYVHMMIEHELLKDNPLLRDNVIELKKKGYKTEPAFCEWLGIEGDPYEGLIQYGGEREIISPRGVQS
ncbi:alpha/beta hydrolase [Pontibacillus halophilus JSM 076056 = DSM 19796]|uniref:Alpha/beta hydrolase n=2 Tax=Pontibacillus TaxID=289201 RepID=A0A0A5I5J0_9BACI|nr:alpha/beta hydrolase [Pontibacillus halophilus JSM 076056 = DSM 19796]